MFKLKLYQFQSAHLYNLETVADRVSFNYNIYMDKQYIHVLEYTYLVQYQLHVAPLHCQAVLVSEYCTPLFAENRDCPPAI